MEEQPCEICGETKELSEFLKSKKFIRSTPKAKTLQYCWDCQEMYIEMRKTMKKDSSKTTFFKVTFE
jgi:hypothetical protein